MIQFQGNAQIGGQREGWKEEQTLFYYRTLPTTVRVYLFSIPHHFHQSYTKKKTSTFVSVSVEEKCIFVLSMFIHRVTTRPYSALVVLLDNQRALVNWILNWIRSLNCLILKDVVMLWDITSFLHFKIIQALHCLLLGFPISLSLIFFQ